MTKYEMIRLERTVEDARTRAILLSPTATASAYKTPIVFDEKISTACINMLLMKINPTFWAALNDGEREFVMVHEYLHMFLKHPLRIGNRDPALSNIAADYEVNSIAMAMGVRLWEGALYEVKFDGLSYEEIYEILEEDAPEPEPWGERTGITIPGDEEGEGGSSNGGDADSSESIAENVEVAEIGKPDDESESNSGGKDDADSVPEKKEPEYTLPPTAEWGEIEVPTHEDGTALSPSEMETLEEEANSSVIEGIATAKMAGRFPAGLSAALDRIARNSITDWRTEAAEFMTETTGEITDYTWSVPRRSLISSGYYLPSTVSEGYGEIAVICDTSGSMSNARYNMALDEIGSLVETLAPEKVHVIYCDGRVRHTETFEEGVEFRSEERHGHGGTYFHPAFEWIENEAPETTGIVVISDMELYSWPDDPSVPTLWVDVGSPKSEPPTWGRYVKVDDDHHRRKGT